MASTDQRLDDFRDEMRRGFADLRADIGALRGEMLAMRDDLHGEIVAVRTDLASLRHVLLQAAFGLIGVLIVALATVVVALA